MTRMKCTMLVAIMLSCICGLAQDVPTPEYPARPYYLADGNTLENLERTDAATDFKVKGMGYGGTELYYAAFGEASKVRFTGGRIPRMFISFETNIDPAEAVTLSKAEVKKDRRRFLLSSRSMTGTVRNTEATEIKLEFKKIRTGLFEIMLPTNLEGGEYAFMPMGDQNISITSVSNIKISCFGIDGGTTGNALIGSKQMESSSGPNAPQAKTNEQPQTESRTYPEPDFDNVIYHYKSADNMLVDLERAVNSKSEGTFGFLNFNNAVSVKGATSPVSVNASDAGFIVRLGSGTDPYVQIELLPCTINEAKQSRDFVPNSKKDQSADVSIPLKFKKLSNNMYLITPLKPIVAGEYLFVNKAIKEKSVFAFRIN